MTTKRILLLCLHSNKHMAEVTLMQPAPGVVRLAGYLASKGHRAEYYDPNLFNVTGDGPSLEEKIREKEWDIIGFSCLDDSLENDIQGMYLAHRIWPDALLVAGGMEAQFNYQNILDKSPCNIVIIAEGEVPILAIANDEPYQNIPGIIFKNNAQPLSQELFNEATETIPWETLPYEAYWDYYVQKYGSKITEENLKEIHTVRVFSRNRCPIGCKFCTSTNQLTWGSEGTVPVISATEDNLVRVIERIVEAHPRTRTIYLTDDDFCINKRSVMRFCEKVIERDFGDLSFMCFARITDLNEEVLGWMEKAGFRRLNIGIESFSQNVLDEMGKRCEAAPMHDTLALLKQFNIKPFMNMIMITPKTNLEDLETSVDQCMRYVYDPFYSSGVNLAVKPMRGSDFFEMYTDFKSEVVQIEGTRHYLRRDEMIWAEDPIVREIQLAYYEGVDAETLRRIQKEEIRHTTATNLAKIKLEYFQKLIDEARARHDLPQRVWTVYKPVSEDENETFIGTASYGGYSRFALT